MAQVSDYTSLITSEHADKPNFVATVALAVQPYVDGINLVETIPSLYDLDTAVGQQLDVVGQWIGLTRYIATPLNIYFSWGTSGLGWGEGIWNPGFGPGSVAVALDDDHYRILLKARVAANNWDGTIPGAYAAWNTVFEPEGYQILIQDGYPVMTGSATEFAAGDMTITLGLIPPPDTTIDPITWALFTGGYLGLKGAGVRVRNYVTPSVVNAPLFAWGVDNANLAGWGKGCWPKMAPGI